MFYFGAIKLATNEPPKEETEKLIKMLINF